MKLVHLARGLLSVGALLTWVSGAWANVVTLKYEFSVTGFANILTCPPGCPLSAPQDTVSGKVRLRVDDSEPSTGLVKAIDLIIDGHAYTADEVGFNTLLITPNVLWLSIWGTSVGGGMNGGQGAPDDFTLTLSSPFAQPQLEYLNYVSEKADGVYFSKADSLRKVRLVDEPPVWALLMTGGFAAMGLRYRRHRRSGSDESV